MLSVKKIASKTAVVLGLSVTFSVTFIGQPSFAMEPGESTAPATVVAQTDNATPTAEELVEAIAADEVSAETRAKIEELLAITSSNELNAQVIEGIITQFRQVSPDVPDEWWDRFSDKIDYAELNELVIPIYAQNFTNEELDGIIAFYRTPIGQSVIEKMPAVIQESLSAGQIWGISIAQEIISDMEADGYDLPTE